MKCFFTCSNTDDMSQLGCEDVLVYLEIMTYVITWMENRVPGLFLVSVIHAKVFLENTSLHCLHTLLHTPFNELRPAFTELSPALLSKVKEKSM